MVVGDVGAAVEYHGVGVVLGELAEESERLFSEVHGEAKGALGADGAHGALGAGHGQRVPCCCRRPRQA